MEMALERHLQRMGQVLEPRARRRLVAYVRLLMRWNRAYNLTGARDATTLLTHHVLDSLSIAPFVRGPRVLDVGSGAGLPGIPLAVAQASLEVLLLDSRLKKTRFLTQAVQELGLRNAEVVRCRAEDYRPERPFDTVVSRAFGSLEAFLQSAGRHCAAGGRLLAMKGSDPGPELAAIAGAYRVVEVVPLDVPGVPARRHLVWLEPHA